MNDTLLRRAIALAAEARAYGDMCAGAIERSGLGRVVYALSEDQLNALKPAGGWPVVTQEGPALYEEARAPVAGYY